MDFFSIAYNNQEMKKPEFLKEIEDQEVKEGQHVKFRAKVKGYPLPRVVWYKDGSLLKNSSNYKIGMIVVHIPCIFSVVI